MTPKELASLSRTKKKRGRADEEEEDDDNEGVFSEYEEDADRDKDKDRIPSRFMTVQVGPDEWTQVPRPVLFANGIFFAYWNIPEKQSKLLQFMLDDKENPIDENFLREHLVPRLTRTHPVSLRLVDWLVVDFARAHNVRYRRYISSLGRKMIVVVHDMYTYWLERWRRRHYDPFRRRRRILFALDGVTYSTTVAQLHFFYMAHIYGFLEYASKMRRRILLHMSATNDASNLAKAEAKANGKQAPRKPLVTRAKPEAYGSCGDIVISFMIDGEDRGGGDGDRDEDHQPDPNEEDEGEDEEDEGEEDEETINDTIKAGVASLFPDRD